VKKIPSFVFSICLMAFAGSALATSAPSIGGGAKININVKGAIVNAGGGGEGVMGTAKQAVGSVLSGNIAGKLEDNLNITGGVMNIAAGDEGAEATACQSVGTVGNSC
jgi:hypothetical protein